MKIEYFMNITKHGNSLLYYLCKNGNSYILSLIFDKFDIDINYLLHKDLYGYDGLYFICKNRDNDVALNKLLTQYNITKEHLLHKYVSETCYDIISYRYPNIMEVFE